MLRIVPLDQSGQPPPKMKSFPWRIYVYLDRQVSQRFTPSGIVSGDHGPTDQPSVQQQLQQVTGGSAMGTIYGPFHLALPPPPNQEKQRYLLYQPSTS
jgi:hypothetical protein